MSTVFKPGLILSPRRATHLRVHAPSDYYPPRHMDRRAELLPSSDQKSTSECVAFAVAGWLEAYRWRHDGIVAQIDPAPIYARAKQIDGFPNQDGTSLEAGLQAAQDLGLMPTATGIREVTTEAEVKQALHRFGVVLSAFNCTDLWSVPSEDGWMRPGGQVLGGHACLLCGWSEIDGPPYFSIQQSWGEGIGWRGFVRMSPEEFRAEFIYGLCWNMNL